MDALGTFPTPTTRPAASAEWARTLRATRMSSPKKGAYSPIVDLPDGVYNAGPRFVSSPPREPLLPNSLHLPLVLRPASPFFH
jgi:hypothetical protein